MTRRSRLYGSAALLLVSTALGLGPLGAGPALAGTAMTSVAGVDPGPAVAAFRAGGHLYVYPGGVALVDAATQAEISTELAGSKVYLTVVKSPALSQADAHTLSDALAADTRIAGHYVLLGVSTGGTFLQISSPIAPHIYGLQLREAIAAHHDEPAAQALQLVTALKSDKLPTNGFPWTGVIVGVALGVAVVLAVFVVWSRQRRRRAALRHRRDEARSELAALTDALTAADPSGRVALRDSGSQDPEQRALKVAWSRQQAAEAMLTEHADRPTVERARMLGRQGAAALEQVKLLRDGVPDEAEVVLLAARAGDPNPDTRQDRAPSSAQAAQPLLLQYTAASCPGYGYGWYAGHGYGFFDYQGRFVPGLVAGESLAGAFDPWTGGP